MSKNIFSNETFAQWAESQTGTYNYMDQTNCAICQYLQAMGLPLKHAEGFNWEDTQGNRHAIPKTWVRALNYKAIEYYDKPRPFAGLAKALREVSPDAL